MPPPALAGRGERISVAGISPNLGPKRANMWPLCGPERLGLDPALTRSTA